MVESVPTAAVAHFGGKANAAATSHGLETSNGVAESAERIRESYAENGYYILPEALTPVEVEELRAETTAICRGERGDVDGFEPSVAGESEEDVLRRYLCVHFPHKISEIMLDYLGHPKIAEVLTKVIGPNVKCMQSIAVYQGGGQAGTGVAPG